MTLEEMELLVEGIKIKGQLLVPGYPESPSLGEKHPCLVLCHGIPRDPASQTETGEMTYLELAEQFCQQGFFTLFFNFRGAGPSEGNFHIKGWIDDLKAVVAQLVKHPAADKTKVFLCGSSAGAAVSVLVAAGNPEISGIIGLACPARFDRLTEETGAREFIQEAKRIGLIRTRDFPPSLEEWCHEFKSSQPIDYVAGVAPRPLLLLHGSDDEVVPVSQAHELYARAEQPKELKIFSGKGHRLRIYPEVLAYASDWLRKRAAG